VDGTATSIAYMPIVAGNYEFMAHYSGDMNYKCSCSGEDDEPLLVTPGLNEGGANVTTVMGVDSIYLGQSVTDNVTVSAPAPFPMPTGTVDFQVSFNEGPWVVYDAGVALVDGTATSAFYTPLAAGNYEFQAVYNGDSNYLPQSSGEDDELLTVISAVTHTHTCLSDSDICLGQCVFDTAFVCADSGLVPTGTVDFQVRICGGDWCTYDAGVVLCDGVAVSCHYTPHCAGQYEFRAIYNGDVGFLPSQSGCHCEPLCVERAPSQTTTDLGVCCHIPVPVIPVDG